MTTILTTSSSQLGRKMAEGVWTSISLHLFIDSWNPEDEELVRTRDLSESVAASQVATCKALALWEDIFLKATYKIYCSVLSAIQLMALKYVLLIPASHRLSEARMPSADRASGTRPFIPARTHFISLDEILRRDTQWCPVGESGI